MDHSIEVHKRSINEICRLCTNSLVTIKQKKNNNRQRKCDQLCSEILLIYGVDVSSEDDTYSKFICNKCYFTIRKIKTTNNAVTIKSTREKFNKTGDIWCAYREINFEQCSVCTHRRKLSKGIVGTQKTSSSVIISPTPMDTQDATSSQEIETNEHNVHDNDNSTKSIYYEDSLSTSYLDNTHLDNNTETFDTTISTTHENDPLISPIFNKDTDIAVTTHTFNTSILANSTPIKASTKQTQDSSTSPMFKNEVTISRALNISQNIPLSPEEEKLATHLVRRKLNADPKKQIVSLKTKGQPITLHRVTKPRKETQIVKTPTKIKRAKLLHNVRSQIAGISCTSTETQIEKELKTIPRQQRQNILSNAFSKHKVKISRYHTLALKEQLGLSWRQGRKHSSLLKKLGIQLENEKSVRALAREMLSDFVVVEKRSFVVEDRECEVPYGRISDLPRFVDKMLDEYEKNNMLTWREGTIPEDEIWIKIGGDHGKNSLKFTLQVANINKPNARNNTVVIAIAAVRDTHTNMQRFLEGKLTEDLNTLQSHFWRDKSIKVSLNGDYEFICKMYGLSGPQGTYPCLWCLMPRKDMHKPNNDCVFRSLDSLLSENTAFLQETAQKKEVSKYHNALHRPLTGIQLDKVCPPYLHMLLGIVLKHHKLLEDTAHRLDTKIATERDDDLSILGMELKKHGGKWGKLQMLKDQLIFETGCFGLASNEVEAKKHEENMTNIEHQISDLPFSPLTPRTGPIAIALDTTLNKHKITPQAYHSRSFVGNHCNKYLIPVVYKDLTDTIVKQTRTLTRNPLTVDEAETVKVKFDQLNKAFSDVHSVISHTKK